MLTGFHLRIAQIIARATGPQGFALGGGYALQAHGVTDRPSADQAPNIPEAAAMFALITNVVAMEHAEIIDER